ncbi:MAG: D-glycero-alpha-D-manno-heptose-1,7-bisphosphate 7-phosphatase [Candidatus Eremiobacter antarcticus]|nr:HAD family hydrolase [Candidatus Eremiobacteraeota bacterium]MBC5808220.1 HAD family hydrolase [Candidatus Eremiobacteraeota bacterium]
MTGNPASVARRAVFFDRDGTLNVDTGYVSRPSDVTLIPCAATGAKRLSDSGFLIVILSNQSAIARKLATAAQVNAVDRRLLKLLAEQGVRVHATYRCPHLPDPAADPVESPCDCRKPKPGMFFRAAADLGIDLARSWGVGDRIRDAQAAGAAGCRAVAVPTVGAPKATENSQPEDDEANWPAGTLFARDLVEAADIIVAHAKKT